MPCTEQCRELFTALRKALANKYHNLQIPFLTTPTYRAGRVVDMSSPRDVV